jgi:hypothetical protein
MTFDDSLIQMDAGQIPVPGEATATRQVASSDKTPIKARVDMLIEKFDENGELVDVGIASQDVAMTAEEWQQLLSQVQ